MVVTEGAGAVARRRLFAILAISALASGIFGPLLTRQLSADVSDARLISLYNIHKKEKLSIVYKHKGRYVPEAMKKINWIMRDWRRDEATKMDPKLVDLLWEIHTELGSREPIHIISGYRSQKTNDMLRRKVGGQARKSRHILGLAVDVHFPDVPLRRLRYSALIRERGGVGYYPTSAIPFVHVDTGRVRHWPRMPRHELALLFPSGKSPHIRGGRITQTEVRRARQKYTKLAQHVTSYHQLRQSLKNAPRPVLVARATPPATTTPWQTKVASSPRDVKPAPAETTQLAALSPPTAAVPPPPESGHASRAAPATSRVRQPPTTVPEAAEPKPSLVGNPRLAQRPSKFTPGPSRADRSRLADLFRLAAFVPTPPHFDAPANTTTPAGSDHTSNTKLAAAPGRVPAPQPATRKSSIAANGSTAAEFADARTSGPVGGTEDSATGSLDQATPTNWLSAPAFDEEHPEELYYRPFPIAPLMTATASFDDPALAHMTRPDVAAIIEFVDDDGSALPLQFNPRRQVAELLWTQQFSGRAVNFVGGHAKATKTARPAATPTGLGKRSVKTVLR